MAEKKQYTKEEIDNLLKRAQEEGEKLDRFLAEQFEKEWKLSQKTYCDYKWDQLAKYREKIKSMGRFKRFFATFVMPSEAFLTREQFDCVIGQDNPFNSHNIVAYGWFCKGVLFAIERLTKADLEDIEETPIK